jgi:hypothetical protein
MIHLLSYKSVLKLVDNWPLSSLWGRHTPDDCTSWLTSSTQSWRGPVVEHCGRQPCDGTWNDCHTHPDFRLFQVFFLFLSLSCQKCSMSSSDDIKPIAWNGMPLSVPKIESVSPSSMSAKWSLIHSLSVYFGCLFLTMPAAKIPFLFSPMIPVRFIQKMTTKVKNNFGFNPFIIVVSY